MEQADRRELEELDRRLHRRLLAATHSVPSPQELSIADLAFVLHDVLVDGLRSGTDLRGRQEGYRDRLGEVGRQDVPGDALEAELFGLGAYATVVGLEIALEEPERTLVLGEFAGQGGGLLRLRRRVPSRWRTGRAVSRYRAAEPTDGAGSYIHVSQVFVSDVRSARGLDVTANAEVQLARIAVEAFYDAAIGTVNAATGWRLAT